MEAVPRMPMLFFDLKTVPDKSEPTDYKVLKEHIQHVYQESPEQYSLEIHSLEALRAMAIHPQHNVDGVSTLKKYYCQLTFLKSRFPISREGPIRVTFSWKEAFSSNIVSSHDIRFEQLCVMFNIGSLHSKLGVMDERVTSEGLKLACSHFQCAAWAFQQLKEINCPDVQMSSSVISFMVNTCLAQAQECVLEQSLTGNRKTIINAKVAAQIVEFYSIALNALSAVFPEQLNETNFSEVFGVKTHEGWKKYLRYKIHYYKAITLLYQGMQAEEEQKMGERVTYYDAAFDKLTESMSVAKSIAKSDITRNLHDLAMMDEAFSFTNDVIEGKRKAARNDNEFIYHEKVPPLDSLGELKGRDLVRGIPFSVTDPDIAGPDIFHKLIPMKAHEDASLYSEEKAKLLRHISAKVEAADAELINFMSSLQLDIIAALHNPERLPQDLVDKCAEMTARPDAIAELTSAMAALSDNYHDVDAALEEIKAMVTEEEESEKEYQEIMGPRPPSIVATDLKREMNKYLEAHRKAQESNETLHQVMTFHVANLKLLCLTPSQLEKQVPPLTEIKTPETEKTVGNLEHLVSKVDEMRHQRGQLLTNLREELLNDEITSQLVTRQTECVETVFQSALKKHDVVVNLIERNLQAQPRILAALTTSYSDCAPTRTSLAEVIHRRNTVIAALRDSYDAYEDLRNKTQRGVEFYEKLGNSVNKLQTRVKGTCKVQEEERLSLLKKENKILPRHAAKKAAEVAAAAAKLPPAPEEYPYPGPPHTGPKLKDFLAAGGGYTKRSDYPTVPSGVRPTPVGSEMNIEPKIDSNMTNPGYVKLPMSYPTPPMPSYSQNPTSHLGYDNPPASQYNGQDKSSGYPPTHYPSATSNSSTYSSGYQANNPSYPPNNPSPYPTGTSGTAPNSQMYSSANLPGGLYSQQSLPENHPSPTLPPQQPGAPSNSPDITPSQQQYGMGYPQGGPTPDMTQYPVSSTPMSSQVSTPMPNQQYPVSSTPYSYAPSAYPNQSQSNNIPQYTPSGSPANNIPQSQQYTPSASQANTLTQQYTPGGNSYTSHQIASPSSTAYSSQYSNSSAYYQYPVSTTPVTTPTYVNTATQPTPYANTSVQASYGTNTQTGYGSNTQTPYPGSNTTSTPYGTDNTYANNTMPYSNDTQYYYGNQNTSGYSTTGGAYPGYSNQVQSYNNQYPSQAYGTSNQYYDQTVQSNQYTNSSQPSQSQQSYPATGVASNIPTSQSVNYTQSYNQPSYTDQTSQYSATSTSGSQPQYSSATSLSQYNTPATSLSQYSTPATSLPQYSTPATSLPQHSTPATSLPQYSTPATSMPQYSTPSTSLPQHSTSATGLPQYSTPATSLTSQTGISTSQQPYIGYQEQSHSPYIPDDHKYPFDNSNYSYHTSYSSAGHSNYLATQSSAYTPHEVTSLAQQSYYNVPYGTQSYMLANGNSYVNTTPSSVTSPDAAPAGSHYNTPPVPNMSQSNTLPASNVDLLADLDVNITQSPLIPSFELTDKLSSLSLNSSVNAGSSEVKSQSSVETIKSGVSEQTAPPPPVESKVPDDLSSVLSNPSFTFPKSVSSSTDITLDKESLTQLAQDVEKLESLTAKSLSGGPSLLDIKWKELTDMQLKDSSGQNISVARCYPMKNRSPDILPYDSSRVELPSTKDDYINASYIRTPSGPNYPPLIVTQAPLPSTVADFWTMVWERSVELVVCLLTDNELDSPVYWPTEKGQDLSLAKLRISLQSRNLRGSWTERILSLQDQDKKTTHVVVHLQLTAWPGSSFPSSPSQFVSLVSETLALYHQQRSLSHHIVVHCTAGIGRSGLFVLTLLALSDINKGKGIPDLVQLASNISASRKNLLRDREHFKFAFQCVLYYTQDLLIKRGVLSRTSLEDKRPKTHARMPSQDYIISGGGASSNVQYSVDYTALEDSSSSKKGHSRKSSTSSICSSSNKAELFSSQVGTLDKLSTLSTPQDPLSMIDPLWPIKKEKDPSNSGQ
ncbi:hypothetical protein WDU94_008450 [Cyamophila willieti]